MFEAHGRFRTAIESRFLPLEKGPLTSIARGSRSANVQLVGIDFANVFSNIGSEPLVHHGISYPPLRGVSEVQDSIPDRFQSLPEWIVPGADGPALLGGMDVVLFLRDPADFESMERQRHETVCRIQPGASSRVRTAGGDRVGKPEGALPEREKVMSRLASRLKAGAVTLALLGAGCISWTSRMSGVRSRFAETRTPQPLTGPVIGFPSVNSHRIE
jgi:hypothetical protein